MADESRLSELLRHWHQLRRHGQSVHTEQLCADCPDLATELHKQIQAVGLMELGPEKTDTRATPAPGGCDTRANTRVEASANDGATQVSRTELTSADKIPAPSVSKAPAIPGYEILGELGRGGMGVVYKARQQGLNRLVALKMVLAGSHAGTDRLSRFRREAEAVARLQHPSIVQIHEIGEHDGLPFFSLEYVAGANSSHSNSPAWPSTRKNWRTSISAATTSSRTGVSWTRPRAPSSSASSCAASSSRNTRASPTIAGSWPTPSTTWAGSTGPAPATAPALVSPRPSPSTRNAFGPT